MNNNLFNIIIYLFSKLNINNMPIYFTKLNGDVREVEYVPTRTIQSIIEEISHEFRLKDTTAFEIHCDNKIKWIMKYCNKKWELFKFGKVRGMTRPRHPTDEIITWIHHDNDYTLTSMRINDECIIQIIFLVDVPVEIKSTCKWLETYQNY